MKKKLLSIIGLGLFVISPINAGEDDSKVLGTDTPIPVKIVLPSLPSNPHRPKAPSKQHIECWYCDGELSFDFVIPEGECTLYVTDYATGFITQYSFDSSDHANVYVGALPNGGSLEIHTETGHTYTGTIVFE